MVVGGAAIGGSRGGAGWGPWRRARSPLVLAVSGCSSIGLGAQPAPPRDPAAEATARSPRRGRTRWRGSTTSS